MTVTSSYPVSSPRRTAWMTARARNAAKRGGFVASIGFLAVILTLLVLVLVPREVNRSVRARVDALPTPADTTILIANLTGALDRVRNAESNVQSLRVAYADRVTNIHTTDPANPPLVTGAGQIAEQSDARKELIVRVARARSAPLIENFRTVGEADFLRNDALIRSLLDSLNEVNRDREAYAALGGPDARYAAMTARLTALGQRLISAAEQRLANSASKAPSVTPAAVATVATDSAAVGATDTTAAADTTTRENLQPLSGDSIVDRVAREALDTAKVLLQHAEQSLKAARETNASIARERERAEADTPARVPLAAMLAAALVVGLAFGYGVAFYREVKHPRIADAAEVERVTDTRVIVHTGASRSALTMRHRRRSDDSIPRVVDTASESYQLLHVTLTGYGDTSREVAVVSNDNALGATVGVNLAVAAARDSRSTLLVDGSGSQSTVTRMLSGKSSRAASAKTSEAAPTQVVRRQLGRDLFVDTVSANSLAATSDELLALARDHDFTVIVGNAVEATGDVILCARLGVTSVDWLQSKTDEIRQQNKRLRAVLLWAARAPSAA